MQKRVTSAPRIPSTNDHVTDDDYATAAAELTPQQISAVIWLTIVMNAFNRVVITSRYEVTA